MLIFVKVLIKVSLALGTQIVSIELGEFYKWIYLGSGYGLSPEQQSSP
jgi:hypothetical protein